MAAIAAYPHLSCNGEELTPRIICGVEDIVMCSGKETTFQFIEDVIDEMTELFPGEYFHRTYRPRPQANRLGRDIGGWTIAQRCGDVVARVVV